MSAFAERRTQDLDKLREMDRISGGRVKVASATGNPISKLLLELHYKTAGSTRYPTETQSVTKVAIDLPARYPFTEPTAKILTPIYHPNVYSSGQICFGMKWLPSQGLDLLVQRIIQIITFDPLILNEKSPANGAALTWYRDTLRKHQSAFPTDGMNTARPDPAPKMTWSDVSPDAPHRTTIACPSCGSKLALPTGKTGHVTCPKCKNGFEART